MLTLSTHQLNIFLVAAETLNFTQAAQRLQMTQPSVSQHIQALEEHFGLPLFARCGRSIQLTEAGLALIPLAREVVYLSQHLEEHMASLKGSIHGHLILGCCTTTGRYVLPRLLACFHRQYPLVRATCQAATRAQALQMLSEGKVHLVIASDPPSVQDVEFHQFASEQIVLAAPLDHPWSKKTEIDLPELCQADFILPEDGSEIHHSTREALAHLGLSIYELQTLMTLGSLEGIAFSIQEGLGAGFIPRRMIRRLVQEKVTPVKVRGLEIRQNICVGRSTSRPATSAQEAFWAFICDSQNPALSWLSDGPENNGS